MTNIKPSDMAHIRLRKDVYSLFYINFKQMEKNILKNPSVNNDVKRIVLLFYIRIAFIPFNSKET